MDGAAWLDASDMGISLYEKAGFEPRSRAARWTKDAVGPAPGRAGEPFDNAAFDDARLTTTRMMKWCARPAPTRKTACSRREWTRRCSARTARRSCARGWRPRPRARRARTSAWGTRWRTEGERDVPRSVGFGAETRTPVNARARNKETEAFTDAAVRRAVAAAAATRAPAGSHRACGRVVPEPLAGHERGEGLSRSSVCQDDRRRRECPRRGAPRVRARRRHHAHARRDPACGGARAIAEPGSPDRARPWPVWTRRRRRSECGAAREMDSIAP